MNAFTDASHFSLCFILQFLRKIVRSILWVVCWSTYLCAQFNMVSEPCQDKALILLQIHTWIIIKNWAKLLLPALHQKRRIYHLISQVKELLIKLAWSTMLGVKKIPKVQAIDLTFSIWLFDLQVYQSSSLHSLQASQSHSLPFHYNSSVLSFAF